jgi:beta-galactosidase
MSDCRRIDGPWRFFRGARELAHEATCDDSAWQEAVLPHTWNADDMAPGRSMLDASVGESWYRVHLPLRKAPNQRYLIRIEAAAFRSDVWCNGMFVGGSDDGFLPSRYDITDCLADGDDQVLAVRVDNRFHPGSMPPPVTDWERYGGLIRPVWLERRGVSYFEDGGCAPRVVRLGDDSAEVVFRTRVWSWHGSRESRSATVRHRVYAPDGSIAAEASCPVSLEHGRTAASRCTAMIDRPRRWDVDDPLLYRVHSELVVGDDVIDTDEQPLGFRDIRWDADTGFFLNGRRLELVGVNAHLDYPGLGHAVP